MAPWGAREQAQTPLETPPESADTGDPRVTSEKHAPMAETNRYWSTKPASPEELSLLQARPTPHVGVSLIPS